MINSEKLIAFAGVVLSVVARDLIAYGAARRTYINAVDNGTFPLPPKPTFDWQLFVISIVTGAIGGLATLGVNVSAGN